MLGEALQKTGPGFSCLTTFCSHWFETSNPRTAIIGFISGTALILVSMTMQGSSKLKGMIQRALNNWRKHATLENQKKRRSNHPTTRIQEKHKCYILLQASIMLFATPVFLVSAPVGLIHKIFSAHAAHAWFCSELTGSLSSYQSSGLMASPNKPSLSATAVEFLHSCESRRAARNSKFGATLRNSDICELHIDQMTCPVSKCQCNSFMESKCIDVNALPAMSFTVYSRSASPVRLDSHRPSCSRTSSLPTVFHKAWQEGRWRFWKN